MYHLCLFIKMLFSYISVIIPYLGTSRETLDLQYLTPILKLGWCCNYPQGGGVDDEPCSFKLEMTSRALEGLGE